MNVNGEGSLYNQDITYIDSYKECGTEVTGRFDCHKDSINNAMKDVDFVIIDGPDVGRYGIEATTNAADLKKKYPKNKIKVFIQGRGATQRWYGFKPNKNNNAWGEL